MEADITSGNALQREMQSWRHDPHAHPEFGFEENRTAAFVAAKLRELGLEAAEGVGGTGVVGTPKRGAGNRSVGLRADRDVLGITEQGALSYKSTNPGIMPACGHDGHTAMLLGAAKRLAVRANEIATRIGKACRYEGGRWLLELGRCGRRR